MAPIREGLEWSPEETNWSMYYICTYSVELKIVYLRFPSTYWLYPALPVVLPRLLQHMVFKSCLMAWYSHPSKVHVFCDCGHIQFKIITTQHQPLVASSDVGQIDCKGFFRELCIPPTTDQYHFTWGRKERKTSDLHNARDIEMWKRSPNFTSAMNILVFSKPPNSNIGVITWPPFVVLRMTENVCDTLLNILQCYTKCSEVNTWEAKTNSEGQSSQSSSL